LEVYIDDGWTTVADALKKDPVTDTAITEWPLESTILLETTTSTYDGDRDIHTAKVVTCNGVFDTENF
jgi:hypothetical protein